MRFFTADFASASVFTWANSSFVVVVAARTAVFWMSGKVLSITPRSFSTLRLSRISSFMASETRALTSVDRPWYRKVNVTEPELSRRWALTALILSVEFGLNLISCRIARLRAMIVFVQPVSGHASNWNGLPPSCGITVMLRIIGVGSACPSRTSLTFTFFKIVYVDGGGYGLGFW